MVGIPGSITLSIALLALFLISITAFKYVVHNNFKRTRFSMSFFFIFIVITLTVSFWQYTRATLPYTIPALILGMIAGYALGVRTEQQKLDMQGLEYYMEHFAHIHAEDVKNLSWWSLVNFYSVMGALVLINLIGLATVLFRDSAALAIATCIVGAFLIGTIAPYLAHLWSVRSVKA